MAAAKRLQLACCTVVLAYWLVVLASCTCSTTSAAAELGLLFRHPFAMFLVPAAVVRPKLICGYKEHRC